MTGVWGKALGLLAAVILALPFASAAAQDGKKMPGLAQTESKPATCKTLKSQETCRERADCDWSAAVMNAEGKIKKRAYCHGRPAPGKKAASKKA